MLSKCCITIGEKKERRKAKQKREHVFTEICGRTRAGLYFDKPVKALAPHVLAASGYTGVVKWETEVSDDTVICVTKVFQTFG